MERGLSDGTMMQDVRSHRAVLGVLMSAAVCVLVFMIG